MSEIHCTSMMVKMLKWRGIMSHNEGDDTDDHDAVGDVVVCVCLTTSAIQYL